MKAVHAISIAELTSMAEKMYGNLVKADVDLARQVVVVDMELHADGEAYLLEDGSRQADLWGINLYPEHFGTDQFIEFDSMINIRPRQGNPSRDVLDENVRTAITTLILETVHA